MERRRLLSGIATLPMALAGCLITDAEYLDGGPQGTDGDDGARKTPAADSVRGHFDGNPDRPECEKEAERIEVEVEGETRTYETAETVPYPEPPETYTEDAIVAHAAAFEEAYVIQDVLCDRGGRGHVLETSFRIETTRTFGWYDEITAVYLRYAGGATRGLSGDGYEWVADLAYDSAVYAVDESGMARADFDDAHEYDDDELASNAPDPLDSGDLVAEFL